MKTEEPLESDEAEIVDLSDMPPLEGDEDEILNLSDMLPLEEVKSKPEETIAKRVI